MMNGIDLTIEKAETRGNRQDQVSQPLERVHDRRIMQTVISMIFETNFHLSHVSAA